jgi:CHAT domain-containing protein/tetratricopeptide (TPR) repeat protein
LQQTGDPSAAATALSNLGAIYDSLGEPDRALDYYGKSLALYQDPKVNNLQGQAVALNNIGAACDAKQKPDDALDYYTPALALWRQLGNREGEANTLNNIGDIYYWKGNEKRARQTYDDALKLWRAANSRAGEAATLNRMAKNYLARGKLDDAVKFFTQALPLAREVGDRSNEALALYGLAIIARANRRFDEARKHIEAALVIIDLLRTKVSSPTLRASFFATVRGPYEFFIDLLMEMHQKNPGGQFNLEALQISERARARCLLEMLVEAHADIRTGLDPKLLERERACREALDDKLEALTSKLRRGGVAAEIEAARIAVEDALTACQPVEALIRTQSLHYASLTQPQPLAAREIQPHLGPDTLLLEYALGNQRSYLWAVTDTAITSYELPPRKQIEAAADKLYDRMITRTERPADKTVQEWQAVVARADAESPAAAAALSKLILAPVAAQLQTKRLLIVADGALQRIPFAVLPEPNAAARASDALVVNHEIVYLPSASIIDVLRRETAGRKAAAKSIMVLADPVFETNDPRCKALATTGASPGPPAALPANKRLLHAVQEAAKDIKTGWQIAALPFTRKEAQQIIATASATDSKLVLDFEASRVTAESAELSQYRIVHFATHGFMNPVHPELSGIVLAMVNQKGELQDGFLRAHEVFNLKLPAELIVLSACQTGVGPQVRGEGMIGLTRGFMYAGAARVVVSFWSVNDAATAALMEVFYKKMLVDKMRPAAALRAAQIEMLKQTAHSEWRPPYFWAPFVLQGEWQ